MIVAACESAARRGIAEVGLHSAYASVEKGVEAGMEVDDL